LLRRIVIARQSRSNLKNNRDCHGRNDLAMTDKARS
jgi:hypothetical protein